MSAIFVQARTSDGEIVAVSNTYPLTQVDGCDVWDTVVAEGSHCRPDPAVHKIDWQAFELVDKLPAEQAWSRVPGMFEVRAAIAVELAGTDQFAAPDRPLTDEQRSAWAMYRQSLRDLSKSAPALGRRRTAIEMIKHWPLRSDGSDAIPHLRMRLQD